MPTPHDPLRGAQVLVAIEDPVTGAFLEDNLTADGCQVTVTTTMAFALAVLQRPTDAAIIDLNGSTFDTVDTIRGTGLVAQCDPRLPVMVLTGRYADEFHRVRLYQRGVDAVLGKPFSYPELRALLTRLIVLGSPPPAPARDALHVGGLAINRASRTVTYDGHPVEDVTAKEFAMLLMLASEPQRVFTKHELMETVWGYSAVGRTRTLDSHACRLRRKLRAAGCDRHIINVWGVGYRLADDALAHDARLLALVA